MGQVAAQAGLIGANDRDDAQSAFIEEAAREAAAEGAAAGTPGIDPKAIVSQILESLTPKINEMLDKRVAGFQKALSEKDAALTETQTKLREYEIAGLTEDERAQLSQKERDEEVERLRLENEVYRLAETHPRGAAIYRRLLEPNLTAAQQVALLEELLNPKPQSEATGAAPAAQTDTVPVDRNNPALTLDPSVQVLPGGEIMSDEVADRILATERWQSS